MKSIRTNLGLGIIGRRNHHSGGNRVRIFGLILFSLSCLPVQSTSAQESITDKNMRFIDYYGFPGGSSAWNSIGYNPKDGYVLFELKISEAIATIYEDGEPKRTRWKAARRDV